MPIQPCLKDYVFAERLGSGSYAVVYKAYRKTQERGVFAIKCVQKESLTKTAIENLLTEISILKKLKHEYIVEMKDFLWDDKYIYIIMEFCSGGDLSNFIQKSRRLPELLVKQFLQQLAKGFQFLRGQNISHMDLKPQNILISSHSNPVLKIADFGFAQYMQEKDTGSTMRGSPLYMAPEILMKHQYDARVDLWSIGVVLYECLFGQAPFSSKSFQELAEKIKSSQSIKIPYGVNISDDCRDLILRLLKRDPSERIDFDSFFNHPFLDLKHMASPESFAIGTKLATEAVVKDKNDQVAESIKSYCEALQYLIPHVHAEVNPIRKAKLRQKVNEYMERAEELKNSSLAQRSNIGDKDIADSNYKLCNFYSNDSRIMEALKILKQAEQLGIEKKFKESISKYEFGLESLMNILSAEPPGEKKNLLRTQISEWLKRAELIKSYQMVQKVPPSEPPQITGSIVEKSQCCIQ